MVIVRRERDNKEIEFDDLSQANNFMNKDGDVYYLVSLKGATYRTLAEQPKIEYGSTTQFNYSWSPSISFGCCGNCYSRNKNCFR